MKKAWKVVLTVCAIVCLCYLIVNFIEASISMVQTLKAIKFCKDNISNPSNSYNLASHKKVFSSLVKYLIFSIINMFVIIALWIESFKNTQVINTSRAKLEILKEEIKKKREQRKECKAQRKIDKLEKELNRLKSDE